MKNPIIVSASSLTSTLSGVKKAAENGAGAVVLKSLFEEQVASELGAAAPGPEWHPEAGDYLSQMGMQIGPQDYLRLIQDAKKAVDIPVFASINCVSTDWWVEYARQLAAAGASGLELNIGLLPLNAEEDSSELETRLISIVAQIASQSSLPLSVKLGASFGNIGAVVNRLGKTGVRSVVLFNRFYQLDIDLEKQALRPGIVFSTAQDYYPSLRWISLLYKKVATDLVAATGVHDGAAALRCILAGAQAVQVCSTVYRNGYGVISQMLTDIEAWMETKGYSRLKEFRGSLSQVESASPEKFERQQYIKALTGIY